MIKVENLSFSYRKNKLFPELNILIKPGSVCGLLGKNGAGKSTLLQLMAGLLFPESGKCSVGKHIPPERRPEFLEETCFVGEEILSPRMKPDEYIKRNAPFYPKFSADIIRKNLEKFEVNADKKLNEMSYGERKKFFLSFTFAKNCSFLLLDEPTNGLDIPSKSIFRKIVAECATEDKIIIISTHQTRDLEKIIDTALILEKGKILFHHSIEEVQDNLLFSASPSEVDGAFYSEKIPGGVASVLDRASAGALSAPSETNLEMLFNAVINCGDKINNVFKKGANVK